MRRQLEQLQQQAALERQREDAKDRAKAAKLAADRDLQQQILLHPEQANRLAQRGVTSVGDVDTADLRPTGSEVANPILAELAKVKSLTELPPLSGSANQYAAGIGEDKMLRDIPLMLPGSGSARLPMTPKSGVDLPPLQSIIAAVQGKRAGLEHEAQIAEAGRERYEPTEGTKGFTGRGGQFIATEPTGAQKGAERMDEMEAGEYSPEASKLKAAQAGAISGAQAGAATSATILARQKHLAALTEIERAMTQARATGKATKQSSETMLALGKQMVDAADKINTTKGGVNARLQGGLDWIQSKFGYDDARKWLDDTRDGVAIMFASSLGHVGVKTQQDVDSTKRIMPAGGLTPSENLNRNTTFMNIIKRAAQLGDQLGPIDQSLPPEAQSAEYQRRLMQILNEVKIGGRDDILGPAEFDVMPDGTIKPRKRGGGY
jgi:hypothetical protein